MRRDIGRAADEGGMAERQQPDKADQQVEGAGEEREAQRLHQEHGIEDEGRDERKAEENHGEQMGRAQPGFLLRRRQGRDRSHSRAPQLARPNKPAGLTSSTIAMMTKITVLEASG